MLLLIAGVLVWSVAHLFPSVMPDTRAALIEKVGPNRYRGLFSLDILVALALIVFGWRSAAVEPVYVPPFLGSPVVTGLMVVSFILFAAANAPGNIKRRIRHPMLSGVIAWSIAHLLANGDSRSIVLFGGLGLWALVSIITINRRDRGWERPDAVPVARDIMTIAGAIIVFAVVVYFHQWLFGVSAIPRL